MPFLCVYTGDIGKDNGKININNHVEVTGNVSQDGL